MRIVPSALAVGIVAPADGLNSVTVNPSSTSMSLSPMTSIDTVSDVWFGMKVTLPDAVAKSSPSAGLAPLPAGEKNTVSVPLRSPVRVTVNVNAVVPPFPSAFTASVVAIENDDVRYSICSNGAPLGDPSKDPAVRIPEPVMMNAIEFVADQPSRSTISCTTVLRSGVCCASPTSPTTSHATGDHDAQASVVVRDEISKSELEKVAAWSTSSPRISSNVASLPFSSTWNCI